MHVTSDELKQRNDPRLLHYRSAIHSGMPKPLQTSSTIPEEPVIRKPQSSPPLFTLPDIVLPPVGTQLPPTAKPIESSLGLDQILSVFPSDKPTLNTAIKMPEALQEPVPARTEVPTRRPSGSGETPPSDKKVIDYRNDPRYKKKTRTASKDDDAFLSPKSRTDTASTAGFMQEDFEIEYMRSGPQKDFPSPLGFSDHVGKPRISELGSSGRSSDSDGQMSPSARYGSANQPLASFLSPNLELSQEDSPKEEVSLRDMFKTIDPTTSPFC